MVTKPKWVKPSKTIPYPAAIFFRNESGSNIAADALIYQTGLLGTSQMTMDVADADAVISTQGKLWINRHRVPDDSNSGVAVPWTVLTGVNTASSAAGNPVFLSNTAGGWSLSAGTIRRQIGRVITANATTGSVLLYPDAYSAAQTLKMATVADSAAVTATATETAFDQTRSIPANFLGVGSIVKVKWTVRVTADNTTDTLILRCRIGAADITISSAIDVAAGDTISGTAWVTTRAVPGAAVDTVGGGITVFSTGAAGAISTASTLPNVTTLATNTALVVDVTAEWSSANAGNSCYLESLIVEAAA